MRAFLHLICDFPSCLQFGTQILLQFNEADGFVLLNALQECTELISNQAVFFLSLPHSGRLEFRYRNFFQVERQFK